MANGLVLLSNRGTPLTSTSRFAGTGDVGDDGDCVGVMDGATGIDGDDGCGEGDDGAVELSPFVCVAGDVGDARSSGGGGGVLDDELAPEADGDEEADGEESDERDDEGAPIPGALVTLDADCFRECADCDRSNKGDAVMDRL